VNVFDRRRNYDRGVLSESAVHADPVEQFRRWLDDALADERIDEAHAMVLATASKGGIPSARVVLLRGFGREGFLFFTNYDSRKARDINENAAVAAMFYWGPQERQVRIEGTVSRISDDESDAYFASRPHQSKLAATASRQSSLLPTRVELDKTFEALSEQYPDGTDVPRPTNWGGYRMYPGSFEFWQGRTWRLHDRLRYTLDGDIWVIDRLAP
jgi:pyridoxamine 5'-phosphate oxidase